MGAQIALLQEVLPPAVGADCLFHAIDDSNPRLRWGTAIVALDAAIRLIEHAPKPIGTAANTEEVEVSHPGTMVVADADIDSGARCTLVCLYGQQIQAANGTKYASTTVHRQISDLAPVLDTSRNQKAAVLVAGDLNVTTQWDASQRDREMDASVFQRMQAHGFRELVTASVAPGHQADCFCPDAGSCQHVRTLRWRNQSDSRPWQTDYAFASPTLAATAQVLDDERWWALSDHAPIAIDLEV
jgi:exonuclease III